MSLVRTFTLARLGIAGFALSITSITSGTGRCAENAWSPLSPTPSAQSLFAPHVVTRPVQSEKSSLAFVENRGQWSSPIRYTARGTGFHLALTARDAVFTLERRAPAGQTPVAPRTVRLALEGAQEAADVRGLEPLHARTNYFLGSDPDRWRGNVLSFGRVRYRGVYPGIDLLYYGNDHKLEYDFVVAPGADPAAIRLNFRGARQTRVDRDGDLRLRVGEGEIRWKRPVAYQMIDGRKQTVAARYRRLNGGRIGFRLARYDTKRPLVIDPTLIYSTYLGGSSVDYCFGMTVDPAGNAYLIGQTRSANFPVTSGAAQTTLAGANDIFVSKFSPTGALLFSTFLGGSGDDWGQGIAVDPNGNIYVTGYTMSTDYPLTASAYQLGNLGNADGFVSKLSPDGSRLLYSTYLGGTGSDQGSALAADAAGNVYVTGWTTSTQFPGASSLGFQRTYGGGLTDCFVVKLDTTKSNGDCMIYSSYLGGNGEDQPYGLALDASGAVYIAGYTGSRDLATSAGAVQRSFGGGSFDCFVAKVAPNGTALAYLTYLGGTKQDYGLGLTIDNAGMVYVCGQTQSSDFPVTPGAFQPKLTAGAAANCFVTKLDLNRSGSSGLIFSTYFGSNGDDRPNGIAVDSWGNVYFGGETKSVGGIPTTSDANLRSPGSNHWPFLTKLNPSGSALLYSSYLGGGTGTSRGKGIGVDAHGNAFLAGFTASVDFQVTPNAYQKSYAGQGDAFAARFQIYVPFDFNGDGKPDILLQNQNTGLLKAWFLNGVQKSGETTMLQTADPAWKVVGTPDLNGDGKPDILWQNQQTGDVVYWLMNGTQVVSSGYIIQGGDPNWAIVGTPDLNGDGKQDILWQYRPNGVVVYWLMNGPQQIGSGVLVPNGNPDWVIVGTPDLNGDGQADLLWQYRPTGAVAYWLMNGTQQIGSGSITSGSTEWNVVGTPDLNGDGQPDLLWQSTATGDIVYWLMNGVQQIGAGYIGQTGDVALRVVGIH